jgi:prepilin-type N-terminal cleavage/methylation domain-containing protein
MSIRGSQKAISGNRRGAKGFSAIELVVAMAVVLIITGVAMPSITQNLRVYQLNSTAGMVADQLKSSRFDAIRRNTTQTCYIQPSGNGYRMWTDSKGTGAWVNTDKTTQLTGSATLVPAGNVAIAGQMASAIGVGATNAISGVTGNVTLSFDTRGAVSTNNLVNVLYIGYPNNPNWGYRAVVILPSGSVQVWSPNGGGSWSQVN